MQSQAVQKNGHTGLLRVECNEEDQMIEDTVCNKPLPAGTVMWASRYHGRTFFFCSLECKEQFEQEPEDYFAAPRLRQFLPPAIAAMR